LNFIDKLLSFIETLLRFIAQFLNFIETLSRFITQLLFFIDIPLPKSTKRFTHELCVNPQLTRLAENNKPL